MYEYDWDSIIDIHKYFVHAKFSFKFLTTFKHEIPYETITCFGIYWDVTGFPYAEKKVLTTTSSKEITYLFLQGLGLEEFYIVQQFTNLTIIDCGLGNSIDSIVPLKNLLRLKELYLGRNKINNLKPLINLTDLEILDLNDNRLVSISDLYFLNKLKKLDVSGNAIYDLSPLSNLEQLEELNIAFNEITEVTSLNTLNQLKWLDLHGNNLKISDIVELAKILNGCKIFMDYMDFEIQQYGYVLIRLIENIKIPFLICSSEKRRSNVDHVSVRLLDDFIKIKGNIIEEMRIICRDIITTNERNKDFIQTYKREHFFEETSNYVKGQFDY